MYRNILALFIFAFTFLLGGCAATGNSFVSTAAAPNDKSVIIFYRPKMYAGSAVDFTIVDNGKQVMDIQNGQYIKYVTDPGMHRLHTDTMVIDKPLTLDLKAGETYFIRTGLKKGMWTDTWYLTRVYEQEAVEELRMCCKDGT